jgi:hypothetical protein
VCAWLAWASGLGSAGLGWARASGLVWACGLDIEAGLLWAGLVCCVVHLSCEGKCGLLGWCCLCWTSGLACDRLRFWASIGGLGLWPGLGGLLG